MEAPGQVRMGVMRALVVISLFASVSCNYDCFCNYDVECPVHVQPTESSSIYAYLYEFDCKPTVQTSANADNWVAIAVDHKVGYAKKSSNTELQICTGDPSPVDIVTSTISTTVTTQTSRTAHTPSSTSTTTHTRTTQPTKTQSTTPQSTTTQPITTQSTTAQSTIKSTTQHTTRATTQPTRVITQTPTTQILIMNTTTPYHPTTTQQRLIIGDVNLCPAILHQYAREDKGALTQYGNRCFEIVPIRAIWAKAENDCRAKGGHLFHIDDRAKQQFIYNWIKSFNFDHAVWTGLHDLVNEEYFQWISGDHLLYTNWYPDRYGNLASHHIENCVLLVPYAPYFGQWDDVQCGIQTLFGDSGQQNPFICEYVINSQHQSHLSIVG